MKNEQDILNVLKEKMEEVEVPENLMPEQIEKKLLEMNPPKEVKKKTRKIYYYGGLAAACLVLAAGVYTIGDYFRMNDMSEGAVSEEPDLTEEEGTTEQKEEILPEKAIPTAKNYEEIFTYLEAEMEASGKDKEKRAFAFVENLFEGGAVAEDSAESAAGVPDMAVEKSMTAETTEADYSTTNVRQEGVDEADVVKTDGRYLYVLRNNNHMLSIVDTENGLE